MIFEYDTVILGSSLNALLTAAQKNLPVIFSDLRRPFRFDYLSADLDLSSFNFHMGPKSLTTVNGALEVGIPKEILWERLLFSLTLRGLAPLSNLCKSLRLLDNKVICSNEYGKIAEINFNNCIYFGDDNVSGLSQAKALYPEQYICYDWIAFNKGGKHDIDFIETDDNFVKRVWFYSSDRIDGNTAVKDACVFSLLTGEQLQDFNYSETTARFKLLHEMESRGMKGLFNGYGPNGNPKYYKFKTTHLYREKYRQEPAAEISLKGVKVANSTEEDFFQHLPQIAGTSDRFLRENGA